MFSAHLKLGFMVQAGITKHALDRVPLSIIFDDSTMLVNLNYFFLRDRIRVDREHGQACVVESNRRFEDLPVVHPESFTREFAEFCIDNDVKGKYSVVPCPAALGRIDEGLEIFSKQQQESWLQMCRELIVPNYDITPEMITHTFVVDLDTFQPVDPTLWEQWGWNQLPVDQEELVIRYITTACKILDNVGLTPDGVTSPGGFGNPLDFYAKCAEQAVRSVTGNPTPYLFKRISSDGAIDTPVWYPDREAGTAMGEVIACVGDYTGSWTGFGEVDVSKYITEDLQGGRLPAVIDAGDPAVLISHWQGFYGLHNEDRRGFNAFKTIVRRLKERDPQGARTRWRKCSEITAYAIAKEMADLSIEGGRISLDLPIQVPEFTLSIRDIDTKSISVDGRPLDRVESRAGFENDTYLVKEDETLVAFTPTSRQVSLSIS
jgi:hypothetical protein